MADWITTAEAARLTGYSRKHIIRLAETGKVKGQRFGDVWQIDRAALLRYVKAAEKLGMKRGPKREG
jgi:excisionase family DNA binding protein